MLRAMRALTTPFRLHAIPILALAVAAVVALAWPGGWLLRAAVGWDAGVAIFLIATSLRLVRARSTEAIRKRAAELDQAGQAVLPISLLAALASIAIVIGEAVTASKGSGQAGAGALLALGTVALSWAFVHLIFALHYAHEFYAPQGHGKARRDRGGLIFPGETEPDYWDFLHFALVIGVASQTADIQISDRRLRRISSVHSVTAFLFNTVIVALAVNFAINLI